MAAPAMAAVALTAQACKLAGWHSKNVRYQDTYVRGRKVYILMYDRPRNYTYVLVLDGVVGTLYAVRNNVCGFDRRDIDAFLTADAALHRFVHFVRVPAESKSRDGMSYLWRRHYTDDYRVNMVASPDLDMFWYIVVANGVITFHVKRGCPGVMGTSFMSEACKTATSLFAPMAAVYTCAKAVLPPRKSLETFLAGADFHVARRSSAVHSVLAADLA